ncbi:MAG: hypothetical protein WKF71_20545 [Pyrinomonadaceae bacterium]
MKKFLSASLTVLLLQSVFGFVLSPVGASAQTQEVLTNQAVIDMVKARFSEGVIIAKIKSSRSSFDTSSSALQSLKKSGATDAVMMAMMESSSNTKRTKLTILQRAAIQIYPARRLNLRFKTKRQSNCV